MTARQPYIKSIFTNGAARALTLIFTVLAAGILFLSCSQGDHKEQEKKMKPTKKRFKTKKIRGSRERIQGLLNMSLITALL